MGVDLLDFVKQYRHRAKQALGKHAGEPASGEFARWVTSFCNCSECDTVLFVSPAALLLPGASRDLLSEDAFDTLRSALNVYIDGPEWETGTPCPLCESPFIGEQPLDAYTVRSEAGTYTQGASGERITATEYWCDGCGETLLEITVRF